MRTEKFNLAIDRYYNDDGQPCCAKSFPNGEVCPFYRTKHFGTQETCVFLNSDEFLYRRTVGFDTLIPHKNCPIWPEQEISNV